MNTSQAFYSENQTVTTANTTNNTYLEHNLFRKSNIHLLIYLFLRLVVATSGILGNCVTLDILKKLKSRSNGHILMVYLAVTDILVCSTFPLGAFGLISQVYNVDVYSYKNVCRVEEFYSMSVLGCSIVAYTIVSVDR